jgi:hypothetical protein
MAALRPMSDWLSTAALFRRGAAAENFGTARARSNPPRCNKTGRRRSNRRERMHSSDVGDRFPCLKRKNQPTIDDRGGILVGTPKLASDHHGHGETKLLYCTLPDVRS